MASCDWKIVLFAFWCCIGTPLSGGQSNDSVDDSNLIPVEGRLLANLLGQYDKRIRPAKNVTSSVRVHITYGIQVVNGLNEQEEYIDTTGYLNLWWVDFRLKWNEDEYDGLKATRIPINSIWRPDILPYNNFVHHLDIGDTMAVVAPTGLVMWIPPVRLKNRCEVDMKLFPFDRQTCILKLGSWTYTGLEVNLTTDENMDMSNYQENKEWTIIYNSTRITHIYYTCCPEPYQAYEYQLTLRRNAEYYTHVFILPAVLIALLVPFHFLLPPDSNERISLGSSLLVSLILLLALLQFVLPSAHSTVPAVGMYYSITFIWLTLSILCSIFVLNIRHRGPRRKKVPYIIREVFLKGLKKLVCLGDDAYYTLDELEAISLRGLEEKHYISPDSLIKNADMPATRVDTDVEEILKQVHAISVRQTLNESRTEVINEWHQVALVLDRVLCFVFILTFLIYTFVLLV